ncbi:MAG: FTR1 family protein [Pseudomonadaceae bacterium]|nr:FTR1 family protein [Pseudomonadaceae bacterium]
MEGIWMQAAGVVFREGLEAMLVLMALAAYLVKAGHGNKQGVLWLGGGLALVASGAAAWVFHTFYGGLHNDMVEAFVMAVAAGLMLYVSGWMFLRQDPLVWKAYLQRHMDKVMNTSSLLALGAVAFLAVFREGAETVLMLGAMAADSTAGMLEGALLGLGVLAVMFVGIKRFALQLPLRPMFLVTSAFLFVMGLVLATDAVKEFQEVGWLTFTPLSSTSDMTLEALATAILLGAAGIGGTFLARYQTVHADGKHAA